MSTAGRSSSRRWLVGLVAVAALAAGGITWAARDDAPYVAPSPEQSAPRPRPAEASAALQDLETALGDGDEDAAAALAPAGDPEAAELLRGRRGQRPVARSRAGPALRGRGGQRRRRRAGGRLPWPPPGASAATRAANPSRAELDVQFVPVGGDRVAIAGFGRPSAGRVPGWLAGPGGGPTGAARAGRGRG